MDDHNNGVAYPVAGSGRPCPQFQRCCSPELDAREDSSNPDRPEEQITTRTALRDDDGEDEVITASPTTKTKTTITTAKDDHDETSTGKDATSTTEPETTKKPETTEKPEPTDKPETTEKPATTKTPSPTAPHPTSEAEEISTETKHTTRPDAGPTEITTVAPPVSQPTDSPTSAMPTSSIGTLMPTAGNTTSAAGPLPVPSEAEKGVDVTAVAAGVGGAMALLLFLVIVGYLIRKRRHSKRMSSTRAESPVPFDDKIGTSEGGGLTAPSSLGDTVEPGPVELLAQNHTSAQPASVNSRSYRTIPSHTSQPQAPPAFRSGSLPGRTHAGQVPSHHPGARQIEEPLVSPITPADYGAHGIPPAAPDYGHAYDQPRRTQSPGQYQPIHINVSQHHRAQEAPGHGQYNSSWPDGSTHRHQHPPSGMPDVVSPMSAEFLGTHHPSPPQRPRQATRAPSSYTAYRPAASRSSSATSSSYAHTGGHYQGPSRNQTPPAQPTLSQDHMMIAPPRSGTPNNIDLRYAAYQREPVPQVPQAALQGRPRLINIGSSNNIHDVQRANGSVHGIESAGDEAVSAVVSSAVIGQVVPLHSGSGTPRDRRSPDYQVMGNSEHPRPGNGYEPSRMPAGHPHWHQHGGDDFHLRGDMNATDTERRDDQFVTSWQKL